MSNRIPPDLPPFPASGEPEPPHRPGHGPPGSRPNADDAWQRASVVAVAAFAVLLALRVAVALGTDDDDIGYVVGATLAPALLVLLVVGLVASRSRHRWGWGKHVAWGVGAFLALNLLSVSGQVSA